MKYGIFLHGLAVGIPTDVDGKWLSYYDPTKRGFRGEIRATDDAAKALAFDSFEDAAMCWRQASGTRPDGRPNRPLTAYSVEIKPLPSDAVRETPD